MPVLCDLCGTPSDGEQPSLGWSLAMERGQVMRYCEECTRQNLRAMEGRLQPEYW